MKLFMLPGMHGTAEFFKYIRPYIDVANEVISLPQTGPQDYPYLTNYIRTKLPQSEPYVLLAESFSGPIAYNIALMDKHVKGMVFVCTFLTNPILFGASLISRLPFNHLLKLPGSRALMRQMLFDANYDARKLNDFISCFGKVPSHIIGSRIQSLRSLEPIPSGKNLTIKSLYLQAANDRLVSKHQANQFKTIMEDIDIINVDGGHALLQTNPVECAKHINQFMSNT